jgi:hypothetical protein
VKKILLLLFISAALFAQDKKEWFPSDINIQPFTANFLEPKAGFAFNTSNNNLRLDISTSRDIYHLYEYNSEFSFGADLFTFTRLRREGEFHFPVEAIDYLFGFNAGYKITEETREYGLRFRLSHISAHFVDGKYDFTIHDWRDGDIPHVYSREFIELFPYYSFSGLRLYAGLTYLFHTTPKEIGKGIYQLGFDYYPVWNISDIITPFIAYDFKLDKIDVFRGNNILTAGLKIGKARGNGISIAYSYFAGNSIHGEYFNRYESYSTFGFNIDL